MFSLFENTCAQETCIIKPIVMSDFAQWIVEKTVDRKDGETVTRMCVCIYIYIYTYTNINISLSLNITIIILIILIILLLLIIIITIMIITMITCRGPRQRIGKMWY